MCLRDLDFDISTDVRERFSTLVLCRAEENHQACQSAPRLLGLAPTKSMRSPKCYVADRRGAARLSWAVSVRAPATLKSRSISLGKSIILVATDAIGMGLNLDVDRVAFAGRAKFDGRRHRWLSSTEIGQIAGRAGRFRDNGEFGEIE